MCAENLHISFLIPFQTNPKVLTNNTLVSKITMEI